MRKILAREELLKLPIGAQISLDSETSLNSYIGFFENILNKDGTNYVLLKNVFFYQKGIKANQAYLFYFASRITIPIKENKRQFILEIVKNKSDKSRIFKFCKKEYYKHITKGKTIKSPTLNKDIWYVNINKCINF